MLRTLFTKVLLLSYKTLLAQINQQEKIDSLSSETTSTDTFYFSLFTSNYKLIDQAWLEWFVGFAEGDASWIVSGTRLFFILTQKEANILYHIQETLGFGSVYIDSKGIARYTVSDRKSILLLIYLFSGNLVLPKRLRQLNEWVSAFNNITGASLALCYATVKLTLDSAWLSGFADAEECFNVSIRPRPAAIVGFRTSLRFMLDQQFEQVTLLFIATLFGTGHVILRSDTNEVYRLTIDSFKSIPVVITYFSNFPLKTYKGESFKRWCDIYYRMLKKEHLRLPGFDSIRALAKFVNEHDDNN
jgi:hypothetical protein